MLPRSGSGPVAERSPDGPRAGAMVAHRGTGGSVGASSLVAGNARGAGIDGRTAPLFASLWHEPGFGGGRGGIEGAAPGARGARKPVNSSHPRGRTPSGLVQRRAEWLPVERSERSRGGDRPFRPAGPRRGGGRRARGPSAPRATRGQAPGGAAPPRWAGRGGPPP